MLYSFGSGYDGKYPAKDLIEAKGTLYGITGGGGARRYCYGTVGCGTIFSITLGGKEKVLHSFGGASDGIAPEEGLIDVHGTLYRTTYGGGASGYGTVFALSP